MGVPSLLGYLAKMLRNASRLIDLHLRLAWLRVANKFGSSPVTDPNGPVVSMTTYGVRFQSVHLTIESIALGETRPSRLILWLDDVSLLEHPTIGIRRLQKRGLEVRSCKDYGPHKKYYPYLEALHEVRDPLVTADDDVLYPRYWLKELVGGYQRFPDVVSCHRARVMELNHISIANYGRWKPVDSTEPSYFHFATGVGGSLYPLSLQQELKRAGTAFMSCCPKADDIWLHAQALRAGFRVRQVRSRAFRLVHIPGTQNNALYHHNLAGGENDLQIERTYGDSDLYLLREREWSRV